MLCDRDRSEKLFLSDTDLARVPPCRPRLSVCTVLPCVPLCDTILTVYNPLPYCHASNHATFYTHIYVQSPVAVVIVGKGAARQV